MTSETGGGVTGKIDLLGSGYLICEQYRNKKRSSQPLELYNKERATNNLEFGNNNGLPRQWIDGAIPALIN